MQVVLVMFKADGERRSFSLARDITVLGRREDCDLRIPLGEVSRKHCRLIKEGDVLRLEDLGSSNGTLYNGERIQEAYVQPGDTIQIGPIAFIVQIDGAPADEELQPVASAPDIEGTAVSPAVTDQESEVAQADVPSEGSAEFGMNSPVEGQEQQGEQQS